MLAHYRAAFRAPGTAQFCAAGAVARLPVAVYPLALVLLFSESGHYTVAGVMAGAFVMGSGVGYPVSARIIDRRGQSAVLVPAAALHALAVLAVCILHAVSAPVPLLVAAVAISGFSFLPIGSLTRARWSQVLSGTPELNTAYSLESTIDELIFILGPIVASVAALAWPLLSLVISTVLVLGGCAWLASLRATEPATRPAPGLTADGRSAADRGARHPSPLRHRGMLLVVAVLVSMGAIFGGVEVGITAFAGQHGSKSFTGLILAAFALGSTTASVLYGARHWPTALGRRLVLQSVVFALVMPLFLLPSTMGTLAVVAVVAGLAIAPVLILGFGLVDALVPSSSLTEGLAWATAGFNVGYGLSAFVVGELADAHGARISFLAPTAAGAALVLATLALHRRVGAGSFADHAAGTTVG